MASQDPAPHIGSVTSGQSHTPGPWEVGQHPAMSRGWIVRPALFGPKVMVLPEWDGGHVVLKSEADARLIAAAPELLEALKVVLAVYVDLANSGDAGFWDPEKEDHVIAAREAIAKAEAK